MSLYGTTQIQSIDEMAKDPAIIEMMLVEDVMHGSDEEVKSFCESEAAQVLVEKAVLKKPTLMRISKQDDAKRRTKLMAYQLAKMANDPEWTKLKNYTAKRKACIAKIMTKYGAKAERLAKQAQKEYIKVAAKEPSTPEKR